MCHTPTQLHIKEASWNKQPLQLPMKGPINMYVLSKTVIYLTAPATEGSTTRKYYIKYDTNQHKVQLTDGCCSVVNKEETFPETKHVLPPSPET